MQLDDVHETAAHNHAGSDSSVAAVKVRARIKDSMQQVRARPAQVLATETLAAPAEVRAELGNRESLRRQMRRWKRGAQPPEPASAAAIDLPDQYKQTGGPNPQPFVIYDNGSTAPRRMMVFASREQLRHLASADRYVSTEA